MEAKTVYVITGDTAEEFMRKFQKRPPTREEKLAEINRLLDGSGLSRMKLTEFEVDAVADRQFLWLYEQLNTLGERLTKVEGAASIIGRGS